MARLYVPAGPLAFSTGSAASSRAQSISPFASGSHLKAALHAHDAETAIHLLQTLGEPMADPAHANYTGCAWETLDPTGRPGLGAPTSLCHACGSAPTAQLSRHVLGIQAVMPGSKVEGQAAYPWSGVGAREASCPQWCDPRGLVV